MVRLKALWLLLLPAVAVGQTGSYVSEASKVIGTYHPAVKEKTTDARAAAGKAFLKSLDEPLRAKATYAIDAAERQKWTNLPARPNAGGVPLGDCNSQQVQAFCDLLATVLSDRGYAKMCHIMLADDQLLRGGRARPGFGTEQFSVVIFGDPSPDAPWGLQLDGHHLGLNVSMKGDDITISPSFIGTQPKAFEIKEETFQPLEKETANAYALLNSLNDEQKKSAILANRRGNVKSGPGTDGQVPDLGGVSCDAFDEPQRKLLLALVEQWVSILPQEQAERRMKQIEAELDQTKFAWRGGTSEGSDISYSIQGPSLIIEYACQDLGGDPLNHLHTMYRDPTNEYGRQL